jgi:O-methyltransferase involved in polyketide biosynthesis
VRTIANLGAGLDARPHRLVLPRRVRWIEVDCQELLAYKAERLPPALPCYSLDRIALDLNQSSAREALLRQISSSLPHAAVLTEGFVVYLSEAQVGELARELWTAKIACWVLDLIAPDVRKRLDKRWGSSLGPSGARLTFAPESGPSFFERYGWRVAEFRSLLDELRASGRAPRLLDRFASAGRMTGVVRLERVP